MNNLLFLFFLLKIIIFARVLKYLTFKFILFFGGGGKACVWSQCYPFLNHFQYLIVFVCHTSLWKNHKRKSINVYIQTFRQNDWGYVVENLFKINIKFYIHICLPGYPLTSQLLYMLLNLSWYPIFLLNRSKTCFLYFFFFFFFLR